jgi:hypothetical protein
VVEELVVAIKKVDAGDEAVFVLAVQVEVAAKLDQDLGDKQMPERLALFPAPRQRGAPGDRTVLWAGDVHRASFAGLASLTVANSFTLFNFFNICIGAA